MPVVVPKGDGPAGADPVPNGDEPEAAKEDGPGGAAPKGVGPASALPKGDEEGGAAPKGDGPEGATPNGDDPLGAAPNGEVVAGIAVEPNGEADPTAETVPKGEGLVPKGDVLGAVDGIGPNIEAPPPIL